MPHASGTGEPARALRGTFTVWVVVVSSSFTQLVTALRGWLKREPERRRVQLTIDGDRLELINAARVEQEQLIDAFIKRHSGT